MEQKMERVNRILAHPLYKTYIGRTQELEKDRRFCRHNMAHFLDVARIACVMAGEEGIEVSRERIYAAALLHDIGRFQQYEDGTPHEEASARLAPPILADCGFAGDEAEEIVDAILGHRDAGVKGERSLRGLLYRADKASRACFCCPAEPECNWSQEKKNLRLSY